MEIMKKIHQCFFLLWNWSIGYCYQFLLKWKHLNVFSKLIEPINKYFQELSRLPGPRPLFCGSTLFDCWPEKNLSVSCTDVQFLPQNQQGLVKP